MVVAEQANVAPAVEAGRLVHAIHGSVFWPKDAKAVKWPADMDVYPRNFPPLRSDRDTVVVGTMTLTAAKRVQIDVDGPDGPRQLTWQIPELQPNAANGCLVALLDQARSEGGRMLPLVDSASLATAKQEIEAGGWGLTYWAREALRAGNQENAEELASAALRRNPNDIAARAISDAVARNAGGVAATGDLVLRDDRHANPLPDGAAAQEEINQSTALEEQWQKDVQNMINTARSQGTVDPGKAESMLKLAVRDLTAASQLRGETRDRLAAMLRTASCEIKRRQEEFTYREQQRIREEMGRREMEMTNLALQQSQNKVKQLMDRFDSLMAEGRQRLAEESAAAEAEKIVQRSLPDVQPTMMAATRLARFSGTFNDSMAVRVATEKNYIDALYQSDKSHIPFPDNPPIVYPDAETWKELTVRRKERYGSMELSQQSPAEKKIQEALKQPTQIEFVETPLKDVVDYLKDLHHIEIQLDSAALKEAGIDESTPVTKNLKGISLRSALKLLLDELQLKYVVHNEVLLITTPAKAESDEYMTTKVYPVADMVLPIKDAGFAGRMGSQRNGLGSGLMNGNPMGNTNTRPFGNGNPMGNGNPFGNGNLMGNANPMGNGNPMGNANPMGNGFFDVPREGLGGQAGE